jgi:hypothetical protein
MACAYVIVLSTQYYTDYAYRPVQSIAEASTTGHGTNIIVGVSVGLKATFIPTITVAIAVLSAYHLGASTGIGDGRNAGLFGTAVATMGMLSNAVYILSMNNFGPIADNAGGITEMSMQPEHVRNVTDRLDAAGNVTKAITKGYSIGSASMACFLLFGAFMVSSRATSLTTNNITCTHVACSNIQDEFSEFSGLPFHSVDIAVPEVLVGGLLGSMIIFYFTGLTIAAVGRTAHEVVIEVRRQFKENPDIMTYQAKPDYQKCVALVTLAALREMRFPGLLCIVTPIVVGVTFRFVGEATNRPLLGAEVLASYLMFGTVTGILMALFLDTAGGAWDNAKKYIELGNFGGKNSEAHKASITGDTVGDPFKDTAGVSTHYMVEANFVWNNILISFPKTTAQSSCCHQAAFNNNSRCRTSIHRYESRGSRLRCSAIAVRQYRADTVPLVVSPISRLHRNDELPIRISIRVFVSSILIMVAMVPFLVFIVLSLGCLVAKGASDNDDCVCPILERPELWQKEKTARWMIHSLEWGVLSTISSRLPGGLPFGNVYSFIDGTCNNATGTPYFYGTFLDQTFQDMKANPKASFTVSEAALSSVCGSGGVNACSIDHQHVGDPENPICARLTLTGTLVEVENSSKEFKSTQEAFFQRHPQMALWPLDHHWAIAKLAVEDIWLIDYFGGASILNIDNYFDQKLVEPDEKEGV